MTVGKGDRARRGFPSGGRKGGVHMRFMLTFRVSPEKGNALARGRSQEREGRCFGLCDSLNSVRTSY